MEYVKMPELLSGEAARILAGNMGTIKDMVSSSEVNGDLGDISNCPKRVKFIFVLNNVVIINVNAAAEEDSGPA